MNRYIKWNACFAAMLLGWLAMPAQAAGFDCAKAGTKVEHLICDNPEISKLDEELGAAYKNALQINQEAESIRQAQKQWMMERNGCADATCVEGAYRKRLGQLIPSQNMASDVQTAVASAVEKKYPPYPDVWELAIPSSMNIAQKGIRGGYLQNGDVMVGYVLSGKIENRIFQAIPSSDLGWRTFFGGQSANVIDEATGETRLDDGSLVKPIRRTRRRGYSMNAAELSDGSYISPSLGDFYRGCYQGPAGNVLTRYKSKSILEPLLPSKVVFLLLDEPITISTGTVDGSNKSAACDSAEQEVTTRVVSLYGEILSLEDGGFLLLNSSYGWVIRFDANLITHSRLLNKKLFVFDTQIPDALFIETITGKNYMDEQGRTKMQEADDDLYGYLNKLRKGDK